MIGRRGPGASRFAETPAESERRGSPGLRLFIVGSLIALTVACSGGGEFDRRVVSADENYMSTLAARLDAAGVDFRVARDGAIAYRSRDEQTFRAIDEQVKKDIAAGKVR